MGLQDRCKSTGKNLFEKTRIEERLAIYKTFELFAGALVIVGSIGWGKAINGFKENVR